MFNENVYFFGHCKINVSFFDNIFWIKKPTYVGYYSKFVILFRRYSFLLNFNIWNNIIVICIRPYCGCLSTFLNIGLTYKFYRIYLIENKMALEMYSLAILKWVTYLCNVIFYNRLIRYYFPTPQKKTTIMISIKKLNLTYRM